MHKIIEIFLGRAALHTEILALRQQVAVLKRKKPVGPENSCGFPKVVVMQSMDCRELDDLALFGWMDRSAVG